MVKFATKIAALGSIPSALIMFWAYLLSAR